MNSLTRPVRPLVILVLGLALTLAVPLLGGKSGRADASCAAPKVFLPKGTTLKPGTKATVKGKWFFADCYDTGQPGTPPPMRNLVLRLKQDGKTWRLGKADANKHGRVVWKVRIPERVHPGKARLVSRSNPAGTRVRIHKRHRTPERPSHSVPVSYPAVRS